MGPVAYFLVVLIPSVAIAYTQYVPGPMREVFHVRLFIPDVCKMLDLITRPL